MKVARPLIALLAVLAAACAPDPPPAAGETPRVEVAEVGDGLWRATWHFAEPVTGMRFVRPAQFLREDRWRVITPGFALARDGDSQVVVGEVAVASIDIEFPIDLRKFSREYEPFIAFTDGSVALYTGHLYATPLGGTRPVTRVVVDPGPGRHLVIAGEVHHEPHAWEDPGTRGTYTYIGTIEPRRYAQMTLVADPGAPAWTAAVIEWHVPALLDAIARRTGIALENAPAILLTYTPGDFAGYASSGGMLHDLLQVRMQGDEWTRQSPWGERQLLWVLAHEAVHLWNGGLAMHAAGEPPWLHEGAADALATLLLAESGVLDADDVRLRAFNACIRAVDDRALSVTRSDAANYACGHLMAWWTELELAAAGSGRDLFALWGDVIRGARAGDGTYRAGDFFDAVRAAGVPEDRVGGMQAFVGTAHHDVVAAWRRAFGAHGVAFEPADADADIDATIHAAYMALAAVLASDCEGSSGFHPRGEWVELAGLGRCRTAREGVRVDRIGPYPLDAPGFAAARYVMERCADHATVDVGVMGADASLTFACPATVPPVRGHWRRKE